LETGKVKNPYFLKEVSSAYKKKAHLVVVTYNIFFRLFTFPILSIIDHVCLYFFIYLCSWSLIVVWSRSKDLDLKLIFEKNDKLRYAFYELSDQNQTTTNMLMNTQNACCKNPISSLISKNYTISGLSNWEEISARNFRSSS
jgi:hypothetical protein